MGTPYTGLTSIDRIGQLTSNQKMGVLLRACYSVLVWMGTQEGEPIGEGVFTVVGTMHVVVFAVVLGLLYAYSPNFE